MIDTFPSRSDLTAFWQAAGVSQSNSNVQFIQAVPGSNSPPSGEETLDVEWSSAMAPGAQVRVYAATDLLPTDLDATYAQVYEDVTTHPEYNIHQMSMSYGEGEIDATLGQVLTDDQYFLELSAAGVTLFASSGDNGSTPDDFGDDTGPLQVENPASDPYVTGVGGTTLVLGLSNSVSSETVWNDNTGASGGGVSIDFGRPAWQTGTGVGGGSTRLVPDVSCSADPQYGAVIVIGGSQETVGGTSWASPTWSAFCALMNQARTSANLGTVGLLGPKIYPLLGSSYATTFRDIISGNNATGGSSGRYVAGTGFDETTGIGSPLVQALTQNLTSSAPPAGVQMPVATLTVPPGFNAAFTVSVTGSATYRWQRMPIGSSTWTNLSDNATYTGSTSPSLTINATSSAMSGDQFQCLVNQSGNVVTTNPPSVLIVDSPLTISALAGQVGNANLQNGTGTGALFDYPSGVAVDGSGNIYVADYSNNNIREITPGGTVTTPYGSLSGSPGTTNSSGNNARFNSPNGIAIDSSNTIYIADTGNNLIRKISAGVVSTIGGSGHFNSPGGIAVDSSGNVYVADSSDDTIQKITPSGTVSIIAGQTGTAGYANGNATTQALFNYPVGVAVDGSGNVYVADTSNDVVRKISSGTVTTLAGQPNVAGYADGLAANALFNQPIGIAIDSANNLYIADSTAPPTGFTGAGNDLLRKITPTGVVSTLAGDAMISGSTNATGTQAQFYSLQAVAVTNSGLCYLADTFNQTIRKGVGAAVTPTKIIALSGSLAFGNVAANSTLTHTLTINNTGNLPLTVSGISYPDGFSGNWSSGTIAAGSSQNVSVTFAPTASATYSGNIIVASDADSGTNTIAASGTGYVPVTKTISLSGNLAFGGLTIKHTESNSLTISNTGTMTLTVRSITYPTGFTGNWSAGAIASNSSQNVTVTFAPTLATAYGGNITVNSDATSGTNTIAATGAGLPAPVLPTTAASSATGIGALSATVSGTANPKSYATTVYFQYGTSISYGTNTTSQNIGSGSANVTFRATLPPLGFPSLTPLTTYHYRTVANSIAGTAFSADKTFKTLAQPSITNNAAAYLGAAGTEIGQSVIPNGVATTAYFQYGTDGATFGNHTTSQSVGSGKVAVNLYAIIPNLTPGTTYYYQMVTTGVAGTFYGPVGSFMTLPITTKPIVLTGAAATGVLGATYSVLGNPAINESDDVAFAATMAGSVATTNNSGIWAGYNSGTPFLIARTGTTLAPGTNSAVFATLSDPVYNNNGAVAFRGILKVATNQATSTTSTGIWSYCNSSLSLVARQGGQAAGYPSGITFSGFTALGLPDVGGPLFLGTLNTNSAAKITSSNNVGIWQVTGGNLQLVVNDGATVNGKTVSALRFLPTLTYVNGQTRSFAPTTGDLVYGATFTDKTTGVFKVVSGTTGKVAVQGDGATGAASAQFLSFGNPAINANDHVAFAATLATGPGGVTTANNSGIWAEDSTGTRQLVARIGTTLAAGTNNAVFATLNDPVYDDTESVAFRGTLKVATNQATSTTATGIWFWSPSDDSLTLVARQGNTQAPVPGCPAGTTFSAFTELALPNQGGVVFLATLNTSATAGVTSANNQGIWAVDTNGDLQLMVRTGDLLNGKTITSLKFLPSLTYVNGQTRSYTQDVGDLVYEATFSDKSSGIFAAIFP